MVLALRQQGMLKGRSGAAPVKLVALAVEVVPLNHSPCKTRGKVAERTGLSVHTRRAQSQTTPHPVSCTLMGGVFGLQQKAGPYHKSFHRVTGRLTNEVVSPVSLLYNGAGILRLLSS